jgi:hypothetical protein
MVELCCSLFVRYCSTQGAQEWKVWYMISVSLIVGA